MSALRTEPWDEGQGKVLAERMVGRYRVVVYLYGFKGITPDADRDPVYSVLMRAPYGWWVRVRASSRSDEARFPRRAAHVGTQLVREVRERLGLPIPAWQLAS